MLSKGFPCCVIKLQNVMKLGNGTQTRRSYLVKDQGVSDSETDGGDLLLVVLDFSFPIGFKEKL